ncbi:hypothetical protein P4123_21785 [Pseudomonas aeruginosa]|nr:hypothetical protein [Pseudomonas aeruginosa]
MEDLLRFDDPLVCALLALLEAPAYPAAHGTRVFCPDRASRLRFTPYWVAIRPVSGLIAGACWRASSRRLGWALRRTLTANRIRPATAARRRR